MSPRSGSERRRTTSVSASRAIARDAEFGCERDRRRFAASAAPPPCGTTAARRRSASIASAAGIRTRQARRTPGSTETVGAQLPTVLGPVVHQPRRLRLGEAPLPSASAKTGSFRRRQPRAALEQLEGRPGRRRLRTGSRRARAKRPRSRPRPERRAGARASEIGRRPSWPARRGCRRPANGHRPGGPPGPAR